MGEEPLEERLRRVLEDADSEQARLIRELSDKNASYEERIRQLEGQAEPDGKILYGNLYLIITYAKLKTAEAVPGVVLTDEGGKKYYLSPLPKFNHEDALERFLYRVFSNHATFNGYDLHKYFPVGDYGIEVKVGEEQRSRRFTLFPKEESRIEFVF